MSKHVSRRSFLKVSAAALGAAVMAACTPVATSPTTAPAEATATTAPATEATATTAPAAEATATTAPAEATATTAPATEATATTAPSTAGEGMLSTDLESPVQFSYMRPVWGPATHEAGSAYEELLFEMANVEIESQIVPVFDYETRLPVLVAGGTLTDVMWHAGPSWGTAHDMIEQGAFLPLNEYLDAYPAVRDAVGDTLWTLTRSPDGNNYFFPNPLAPYVPFPYSYRVDIYDQLGLEAPESLEELVEQLEQIKTEMPDMIPLTAHEYSLWYFQNTGVAHGYSWGNWIPAEGEPEDNPAQIVPSEARTEYKDFLLFLQDLRRREVIDPDYMIATGLKGIDKFRAGQAVVMTGHWGALAQDNFELHKVVSDGDISYMPQLQGPVRPMGALTLSGFDRGFGITVQAEDKIDNIFKFLNWVYTEGYEFMRYGVEGETYNLVDGVRVSIPDTERDPGFQGPNVEPFGFPPKAEDTWPKWDEQLTTYEQYGVGEKLPDTIRMFKTAADNSMPNWNHLTFSPTAGEVSSQLFEQYTRPMQERFAIDPDLPDTAYDEAVQQWMDNGGATIIEEVNEIQTDKSPIKPVYEIPEQYQSLLEG